jgi:hypothetical protein
MWYARAGGVRHSTVKWIDDGSQEGGEDQRRI